jgi:sulfonate transport system substrate-binding protein
MIPTRTVRDSCTSKGKQFFFEKKNQKTFAPLGTRCVQRVPQWTKVFASFFKKKRFPALYGSASIRVGTTHQAVPAPIPRRPFLALCLAATVTLAPAVAQAAAPTVIRIGMASAGVGGRPACAMSSLCLAHARGLLEQEFASDGTKVEWHFYTGAGPAVNEALAGGQVDLAWQGDLPSIVARAIGLKTRLLMSSGGRLDYYIAVPSDSPIKTLADLRGKKLALFKGTNIQIVGERILESEGLGTDSVQVVNLDPSTALAALASHQIDATLLSFWGFGLRDSGKIRFIYSTATHSPRLTPQAALLVTDSFLAAHPTTVQRAVNAFLRAARWASDEDKRQEIAALYAKTGYPIQFFLDADAGHSLKLQNDPQFDPFVTQQYKDVVAISLRTGLIHHPVSVDDWIDAAPLNQALAQQGLTHFWPRYAADGKTVVGE